MHIYMVYYGELITIIKLINIFSYIATIFLVMWVPEIVSKCPVSNTLLLTVLTMMYVTSLDLFILHNYNFVLLHRHLPFSPASLFLITTILLSASKYLTLLDSI